MTETKFNLTSFCTGFGASMLIAFSSILYTANREEFSALSKRIIPNVSIVQQGFIAPSKLEVKCDDLDGNGEQETIVKIGNEKYLLREVDRSPVLSKYEQKDNKE